MIELEVQTAIYNALSGLSYPVYDDVPQDTQMPYIVIGDDTVSEDSTDGNIGFQVTITIHSWSNLEGRKQIKQIQGAIFNELNRQELTLNGYSFTGIEREFSQSFLESDGNTRHGVERYRLLADEV